MVCIRRLAYSQSSNSFVGIKNNGPVSASRRIGKAQMVLFGQKNGPVAEWLGKALQKLLHRFESGRDLQLLKRHCE